MTGTLTELALAAAVFVASHVLISGTRLRDRLVGKIGERPYLAAFSALSLLLIWWLASTECPTRVDTVDKLLLDRALMS